MIVQFIHDVPGIIINEETRNVNFNLSTIPPESLEKYYNKLLKENLEDGHFPGLFELAKHEEELRSARAVKGHLTGPVTMGLQILGPQKTPILYEQTEMELVLKSLKMKARWQQNFLKQFNSITMIFFDEPGMTLLGSPCVPLQKERAISLIEEVLKSVNGVTGIHCCGNTDWSVLLETSVDVLSFDSYNWAHTLALYASNIEGFLTRGGKLAWGIVPTLDENIDKENIDSLMTRFQKGLSQLVDKGINLDTILESSFITPACGLGMTTPINAEKALRMISEISRQLRRDRGYEE